jgi:hypothetical protein
MEGGNSTSSGSTSSTDRFVLGNGVRTGVEGAYLSNGVELVFCHEMWFAGSRSNALCIGPGVSGIVPGGRSFDDRNRAYGVLCLAEPGTVIGDEY